MTHKGRKSMTRSAAAFQEQRTAQEFEEWRRYLNYEFAPACVTAVGICLATKTPSFWAAVFLIGVLALHWSRQDKFPEEVKKLRRSPKTDAVARTRLKYLLKKYLSVRALFLSHTPFVFGTTLLVLVLASDGIRDHYPFARHFIETHFGS